MRTSFHHQPEAQHPNFQLSTSWQADYPIFRLLFGLKSDIARGPSCAISGCEQMQQVASLLDHLVGAGEQRRGHVETERLRSLEVNPWLIIDCRTPVVIAL
jgi:hypothetical protein